MTASMLSMISETLKDLAYSVNGRKPFGGLPMVLFGDLKQLGPVVKGLSNDPSQWITFANEYPLFVEQVLQQNFRQSEDDELFKFLEVIRQGPSSKEEVQLARNMFAARDIKNFPDTNMSTMTLLTARTKTAKEHNTAATEHLSNEPDRLVYIAEDSKSSSMDARSWMAAIEGDTGLLSKLALWTGARVILTSNLVPEQGIMNGSIGVVLTMEQDRVQVEFHSRSVLKLWICREARKMSSGSHCRRQLPLLLVYALTIHRAQGLTLEKTLVDLEGLFCSGQAYVGLSRVRRKDDLFVRGYPTDLSVLSPSAKQYL